MGTSGCGEDDVFVLTGPGEKGCQSLSGGATYAGQWRGEDKHGQGTLVFADGSRYEGQFDSDRKHGFGKYTYSNGSTYEGQWKMEVQDGHGMEKLVDGSVFEGQFKNGDKSGKGTFTWNTGGCYEGEFEANDMHGEGRYQWNDGRSYVGQWRRNHLGPSGTMKWTDGRCYEGQFRDGKKHGEGKLSWPDGRSYTGQWDTGRQHGVGITVTAKGLSRKSQWEQGNFVCWLEDDLRAELLEAQHREAEAQDALKQSAEFGQVLLSRNEALEQEVEALRQERSRAAASEVSWRSRLEDECRRLELELESLREKRQDRSRLQSADSDEEPSVALLQRLKRCEKSEQEHREAAYHAEEQANLLEEKNQQLEEECRRLHESLRDAKARPSEDEDAAALKRHSEVPSPLSPCTPSRASKPCFEDLEQQLLQLTTERDAACAERAAAEARCQAQLHEMEQETLALRLLLEEEANRTDALAQHVDHLGQLLEERQAANGAAVMLRSLGMNSRANSPDEVRQGRSMDVEVKGLRRSYRDSSMTREEVPSLQSFLADLRSRSPSMTRKRSRPPPFCSLEDFLGERPVALADVTASTRAVASVKAAKAISLLEMLGWSRCDTCGSILWSRRRP